MIQKKTSSSQAKSVEEIVGSPKENPEEKKVVTEETPEKVSSAAENPEPKAASVHQPADSSEPRDEGQAEVPSAPRSEGFEGGFQSRPPYGEPRRFHRDAPTGASHSGGGRYDRSDRYSSRDRDYSQQNQITEEVKGFLDVQPEGHGFLRPKFIPSNRDIYISQSQIRRFMLRGGDLVEGVARPPKDTERYYGLLKVEKVNDIPAEESLKRPYFDDLTAIYPDKQLVLSTGKTPMSTRIIDLVAPIGLGQRGMVVSPPKAGKTTILKEIAAGISENFPDVHLMAALIGERPEEVTDISMSVKGEVVASNFDEPPDHQTRVAEITLERAKRMVEMGKDVVILLDSITRLARAYNLAVDPSGRTLSGGFDPAALYPAKRFFGAARNCREGGSLTIIGTALVDTGSRMDDLIYEEFKGTGNMELHLDRKLAERRIFPAINIERSGTRGEERILKEDDYKKIVTMRRMMDMLNDDERTSRLVEQLVKTDSNDDFLKNLGKGA